VVQTESNMHYLLFLKVTSSVSTIRKKSCKTNQWYSTKAPVSHPCSAKTNATPQKM